MKKNIVVGNWKMNNLKQEALAFVETVNRQLKGVESLEFGICVPSVYIDSLSKDGILNIGAQNMHFEEKGAFTGEISAEMLKDVNAKYVIIGHSERREIFGESDEVVNLKLKKALKANLVPIVCCGETLEEYKENKTKSILKSQIEKAFKDIKSLENIVVAYEPIWAIGTGLSASSDDANEMCKYIRQILSEKYGDAKQTVIQYGGSVKPNNISEYLSKSDIDGALVGGASLTSEDFISLINNAK